MKNAETKSDSGAPSSPDVSSLNAAGHNVDSNRVLWVLGAITLAYIAGLALVVWETKFCDDGSVLSCRTLNELGDFLAGAFAPLAFFLLAGAVYMQSRELKAQRQELRLARAEYSQTRQVLAEQRDEARATKEFIGEQTELLKKEQQIRVQEQADAAFDEAISAVETVFTRGLTAFFAFVDQQHGDFQISLPLVSIAEKPEAVVQTLLNHKGKVRQTLDGARSEACRLFGFEEQDMQVAIDLLTDLTNREPHLSPAYRLRARRLHARRASHIVEELRQLLLEAASEAKIIRPKAKQ